MPNEPGHFPGFRRPARLPRRHDLELVGDLLLRRGRHRQCHLHASLHHGRRRGRRLHRRQQQVLRPGLSERRRLLHLQWHQVGLCQQDGVALLTQRRTVEHPGPRRHRLLRAVPRPPRSNLERLHLRPLWRAPRRTAHSRRDGAQHPGAAAGLARTGGEHRRQAFPGRAKPVASIRSGAGHTVREGREGGRREPPAAAPGRRLAGGRAVATHRRIRLTPA